MKRFFSFMAVALVSVAMWAGANDLLWDYSEGAPSSSPDNGLYFSGNIKDGPGTKNGLYGVKLNDGGFAYFRKAAVAGKLKLGFGPRSGSNAANINIYTWSGDLDPRPAVSEMTLIATTKEQTEYGFDVIELTAEQQNIYMCRKNGVETAVQYIQFKELVPRSFVDFKIEFRDDPYTVLLPEGGSLPTGVKVEGTTYNGGQHGVQGGTITVPVDGMVKFTIGACQYSKTNIVIKKDGAAHAEISNVAPCGEQKPNYAQFVTWTYMGDAGTLTFEMGSQTYVPYFFAEATELTPCQIIFKDQTGKELGRVDTYEGEKLEKIPYTEADLPAISKSEVFRGWYYTNGKRANTNDIINGNTTIQAKVTPYEYATVGSVQTYPLTSDIFYPSDHETIDTTGNCYYHDGTHGWAFKNNDAFSVKVAGNAVIMLSICQYGKEGATWKVTDAANKELGTLAAIDAADGKEVVMQYKGEATTITFTLASEGENYLHKAVVYNVLDFMEKDASTGYYIVPKDDAASLLMALVMANSEGNAKIFLPNGTYDLGETVLTTISGNNISLIGESMEGVIIKNAPDYKTESIDKTATIKINKNVTGTYLQDLTIQNALDYYKNDNGRAVALWDQGTKTICKNVRLLSYQDTYYSNLQGAVKYFEDCEIHGTVDFICGDGSVYFKKNLLYCEKRKAAGGGADCLTANNGVATDKGYVFDSCVIRSECANISLGRAWNNQPKVTYLNTVADFSKGSFEFKDGEKVQRWTKELMNANAWPTFGEYNTMTEDGKLLTPESNKLTFVDPKSSNATKEIETVLTKEQAAAFTMEYTLGEWAATAKADAQQAECEKEAKDLEADAIYLAEAEGKFVMLLKGSEFFDKLALYNGVEYVLRKANSRGGFGKPAQEESAIESTQVSNSKVQKIMRDGQLLIVREGKTYNAQGAQL